MKTHKLLISRIKDQSGATAILLAVAIVVLVSIAALAVDIGYVAATKNELQNVADAAALACASQLGWNYKQMSYDEQQNYVCDPSTIIPIAQDVAGNNQAGAQSVTINNADVIIGQWNGTFTATLAQPTAVKVTARRDGSANGPITTFFAKIFGVNIVNVQADAIAALTAKSTAPPGGLPLPVGISKAWFEDKDTFCNQPLKFYPTNSPEGCAGWHTYTESPPSASQLSELLNGLKNGTYESPETIADDSIFEFTGGTIASVFEELTELFDFMKVLNDGILDSDDDSTTWTTAVVVYDWDDCSNPNKPLVIVGFATVTITEILETPEKTINAIVICENIEPGRGSGGDYGTIGTIGGLVE